MRMISIVIPTYNEEKYLPLLLNSIKNQTLKNYEIIVADNSKDNTKQIANRYKCKIVKGGLPGKARNNGADNAKYDLLFIDADVVINNKNFLKNFLAEIKEQNLEIATCKVIPNTDNFSFKFYYFLKNNLNKYWPNHTNGQFLFMKKKLFSKINGYDPSLKLGEEHDLIKRAKKSGANYKFYMNFNVNIAPRRLQKEGFCKLLAKATYSEIYRLFFKIKKNIFKYEYGKY
jgi:glycosyltransferase involved in cell wall biosynthesis